jgi:hypothetical protein
MPSPFPGMDPFLEDPELWPDVHHELISDLRARINKGLSPRYVARLEVRVFLASESSFDQPSRRVPDVRIQAGRATTRRPAARKAVASHGQPIEMTTMVEDDETEEAFIKIIAPKTGEVVTVIEVLSPTNKTRGSEGRAAYTKKQTEVLHSPVHLVEIDLLRGGAPTFPRGDVACDYALHVSRVDRRPRGKVWRIPLRSRLPTLPIPLQGDDPDFDIDLQGVLATAYDRGAYHVSVGYSGAPVPPLRPEDAAWADKLLRKAGLRRARRAR